MSDPVFEVAYIPLKPATDLTGGESGQIWSDTLNTVAKQNGCKAVYWGRQVERPDTVELVIEWETHDHHLHFIASPAYAPFIAELSPLVVGHLTLHHLRLSSSFSSDKTSPFTQPGTAPVTECVSMYLQPDYPSSKYEENWNKFAEAATKTAKEARGITGGWAIEDVGHEAMGRTGEEGKAKLFGAFIGWPSVQAHMAYRESPEFPEVVKWLREGPKALEVHHVQFQRWE